ncbi:YidB family protein [Thermodesulfobacteriota bacterium]
MGLFDDVKDSIVSNVLGSNEQGNLLETVMGFLQSSDSGGLSGLVNQFQDSGLGDTISSWIGTGSNQPISPEEMQQAMGAGQINRIAEQMGVSSEEASNGLADMLPQIVDNLTPDGEVPSGDLLSQGLGMLSDKIFGK